MTTRDLVMRGVMEYFSEYASAAELGEVVSRVLNMPGSHYQDKMQRIRRILREEYDKRDIPLMANYRRFHE
uniref:Uncharacterized protein n=1 Tax=viral metagenome TaxID=1070528 RepID=A0A6M3IJC8_9ZZZZ